MGHLKRDNKLCGEIYPVLGVSYDFVCQLLLQTVGEADQMALSLACNGPYFGVFFRH